MAKLVSICSLCEMHEMYQTHVYNGRCGTPPARPTDMYSSRQGARCQLWMPLPSGVTGRLQEELIVCFIASSSPASLQMDFPSPIKGRRLLWEWTRLTPSLGYTEQQATPGWLPDVRPTCCLHNAYLQTCIVADVLPTCSYSLQSSQAHRWRVLLRSLLFRSCCLPAEIHTEDRNNFRLHMSIDGYS